VSVTTGIICYSKSSIGILSFDLYQGKNNTGRTQKREKSPVFRLKNKPHSGIVGL
jgi:hypothetical protein